MPRESLGAAARRRLLEGSSGGKMHRRAETAGTGDRVFNQLAEDFPKEKLGWVRSAHWHGPIDVPLDEIDFSNRKKWRASKDQDHVEDFAKDTKNGTAKPAVLVNEPNNKKLIIVDGHHRALAAEQANKPLRAFVANVGMAKGPWDELHGSQRGDSEQSSIVGKS